MVDKSGINQMRALIVKTMKIKRIARILMNFIAARYLNRRKLIHIELEITRKCNYHCRYCNLGSKNKKELDAQYIIRLLDKYKNDIAFVFLSGGEPLLYSQFNELVDNINRREGIYSYITTNGSLFAENIAILKKIDFVWLSLDGPKEIHEVNRPTGSFGKIMEAIRLAKLYKINVAVTCVLNKENVNKIDSVLDFFEELDLCITFAPINLSTQLKEEDYNNLKATRYNLNGALEKIIAFKKRTNKVLNSFASLKRLKGPTGYKDCYWGRMSAYVNVDGFFQPCCLLKDQDTRWNIRNEIISNRYLEKGDWRRCKSCEQQINLSLHEVMNFLVKDRRSFLPRRI